MLFAIAGNKETNSIATVDVECKGAQRENKVALDQEGKQEEQEGTEEDSGMVVLQKRKDKSQAPFPVRRKEGLEEGKGGGAMVLCNFEFEGSIPGTRNSTVSRASN